MHDDKLQGLQQALRNLLRRCPTIPVAAIRWVQVQYPVYPEQDELLDSTLQWVFFAISPASFTRLLEPSNTASCSPCVYFTIDGIIGYPSDAWPERG